MKKMVKVACLALVSAGLSLAAAQAATGTSNMEKCYGISKAGSNDCGGKGHTCQGQATTSGDKNDWLLVPKGLCDKINGGSTKAG